MTIFDNDGPGGEKSGEPNAGPFPEGEGMTNLIYLAEQIRTLEVLASEAEIPHVRSYIRRVAAQFRDALDELTTVPALMDAVFPWPPKQ